MSVAERLIKAATNGNGLVLNKPQVEELALTMHNMAEDIGKLMFLSDYFEKRYFQYRDYFGPVPEVDEVLEGMIEDVQTGQVEEEVGSDPQSEGEGTVEVPDPIDERGGEVREYRGADVL